MTSSESETNIQSRKRVRTGSKEEEEDAGRSARESKKARGRPRVDTQDATAADRRRTQIRLAQRAYRQRKETTIVSLKQQRAQLQSIIEQMNTTFVRFSDSALKSGLMQLNASVAQEHRHAKETFNALAKSAVEIESLDDEPAEPAEHVAEPRVPLRQENQTPPDEESHNIGWGYALTTKISQELPQPPQIIEHTKNKIVSLSPRYGQQDNASIISRPQYNLDGVLDHSRSPQPQTSQPQEHELPFGLVDLLGPDQAHFATADPQIYPISIPTPNVTPPLTRLATPPIHLHNLLTSKTLPPISTYSYHESTFARKLHRGTLEAGFRLLDASKARPTALSYIFKLSLPYMSVEQLRARFSFMLSRDINEDLDFWETPFIHLGGAGTHYPRKDINGNIVKKKNSWTIRRIGPLKKHMIRLECVDDGRWEDIEGVDLSGFEGEWFDAHDVQGYIEENWTCTLNSAGPFTQCLITADELPTSEPETSRTRLRLGEAPSSPGLTSDSSAASSIHSTTPPANNAHNLSESPFGVDMSFNHPGFPNTTDYSKFNNNVDLSFDQTLGLDLAPGFDYGYSVDANFVANMNLGLPMASCPQVAKQKDKKIAWLDSYKLIEELMRHTICLGRAPGFRRADVDVAVRKALIMAL